MKLFDKTWKLALSGVVIGLLVMLLAMSGPGQHGNLRNLFHPRRGRRSNCTRCTRSVFPP